MTRLLALLLALAWALPAAAQQDGGERILDYDVDIAIQTDGSVEITERITVRAEGRAIRRGIVREFPTRYRDRFGDRVVVDFEVLEVLRNGQPEPWFTERVSNGVRVNTGNDDFLPVPAEHVFTLRYRTNRQLGFFEQHDELYFNAMGHSSSLRVDGGTVTARLPEAVPVEAMELDGFTGREGGRGRAFHGSLPEAGVAHWELSAPLARREGFTVLLTFPKGVVAEPDAAQRLGWRLRDNAAAIVALAGLALLLAYCVIRWRAIGRDPHPGTIIVRYEPPAGYSPAELRYMQRRAHDSTGFSADLLAAAVAGVVAIQRETRTIRSDRWTVHRADASQSLHAGSAPARLAEKLLRSGADSVVLQSSNASRIQEAMSEHRKQVGSRIVPALYRHNAGSVGIAALILIATLVASVLLVVLTGSGFALAGILLGAGLAVTVTFGFLIGAPTPAGRELLDQIEGFRRYLGVAEKQDLQALQGPSEREPELDAGRFERLLPYAVALDVEDAWTGKFTAAVGAAAAAAATASMTWYAASGRGANLGDLGGMTRSLSKGLSSQIASSSSPPGSSSGGGGGGGGFSGGGGGGGGVGGR